MDEEQTPFCTDMPIESQFLQTQLMIDDYSKMLASMPEGGDKTKAIERLEKLHAYSAHLTVQVALP